MVGGRRSALVVARCVHPKGIFRQWSCFGRKHGRATRIPDLYEERCSFMKESIGRRSGHWKDLDEFVILIYKRLWDIEIESTVQGAIPAPPQRLHRKADEGGRQTETKEQETEYRADASLS